MGKTQVSIGILFLLYQFLENRIGDKVIPFILSSLRGCYCIFD